MPCDFVGGHEVPFILGCILFFISVIKDLSYTLLRHQFIIGNGSYLNNSEQEPTHTQARALMAYFPRLYLLNLLLLVDQLQ